MKLHVVIVTNGEKNHDPC